MVTGTKITAVLSLVGNTTYGQHRVCVPGVHALPVHQRILCYQYGCNIAKLEWYLESLHISQSQAELLPTVALVQHGKSFNKPEKQRVRAIAAAAESLQSCPTLCNPTDGSPPGSPIPGILQAGTLEWVAISFSNAWKWKVKVKSLRRVRLFATPWTAAYQAPPAMGFSRQE